MSHLFYVYVCVRQCVHAVYVRIDRVCEEKKKRKRGKGVLRSGSRQKKEACHIPIASKFYTLQGNSKFVCERHYYEHLGLLCLQCHEPIRGPVDPKNPKYHTKCLRCPHCILPSAEDACYEYNGRAYCRYHFSQLKATQCAGCSHAVLKQYVEHRDATKWHPECYMIQKFWNVRLTDGHSYPHENTMEEDDEDGSHARRLEEAQTQMEKRAKRIWTDLSAFEESSATCISDMLLHVAAGAYSEGLRMANQFVAHLEILFSALDKSHAMLVQKGESWSSPTESRLVCQQVIRIFYLLAQEEKIIGVTQDLLGLVTGVAQNLKSLIRLGLTDALRLEKDNLQYDGVSAFLDALLPLEQRRVWMAGRYWFKDNQRNQWPSSMVEQCQRCRQTLEEACIQKGTLRWHPTCFNCARCHKSLATELHHSRLIKTGPPQGEILLCCEICSERSIPRRNTMETDEEKQDFDEHNKEEYTCWVSQLEQCLSRVKAALARLHGVLPDQPDGDPKQLVMLQDYETKINRDAKFDKRQSSLMRLMSRPNRHSFFGSVNLTTVRRKQCEQQQQQQRQPEQQASEPEPEPLTPNPTALDSKVETNNPVPWPTSSPVKRAVSVQQPTSRFGSIRRALSTHHPRRRRRPLQEVFLKGDVSHAHHGPLPSPAEEAQRASVCTMESRRTVDLVEVQDHLLRHMAVICADKLNVTGLGLEELVQSIESSPGAKASSFWHKLKRAVLTNNSQHPKDALATFGIPLAVLATRGERKLISHQSDQSCATLSPYFTEHAQIPAIVQNCILALQNTDIQCEGVFRKNGNIRELNQLCRAIDQDASSLDYLQESPIQVAALLKRYLRELPEPLLTFKLYPVMMAAIHLDKEHKQKQLLHYACCMLPKPNRDTMQLLFLFLHWVASFKHANRMDITNLARVFAPTVFYGPMSCAQHAEDEIRVVEMLIKHQEEFCHVPHHLAFYVQHDTATIDIFQNASSTRQKVDILIKRTATPSSST
ncbi:hypothetical protein BCR43DRAFT_86974 [Syncephalastrum racemosum]|uniref:Uncharacterized protein n=1 Tax=Syncephalastrum racemosum TaxID=13706 RepID=A0A1X2H3A4_SYNRA|nr:hypothetical protein BCR43DRAFT_86974 [Syncephalastrum racemosum]